MKTLKLFFTAGLISLSLIAAAQKQAGKSSAKTSAKAVTPEAKINNRIDSVSYAIGIMLSNSLKQQGFDSLNIHLLNQAIADAYKNQGKMNTKQSQEIVNQNYAYFQQLKAEKNLKEGQKFLEENKKKPGVHTLPSGLQYMILKEGNGPKPTATDKVTTHYHGTLINGTVFDSSVERGTPATFPVNGVIQGWVEALQLMPEGSKWRLFIPANLAYGERGQGNDIGPNSALIFDVELISINK